MANPKLKRDQWQISLMELLVIIPLASALFGFLARSVAIARQAARHTVCLPGFGIRMVDEWGNEQLKYDFVEHPFYCGHWDQYVKGVCGHWEVVSPGPDAAFDTADDVRFDISAGGRLGERIAKGRWHNE